MFYLFIYCGKKISIVMNFGTKSFRFTGGHFEWDSYFNGLVFVSHEVNLPTQVTHQKKTFGTNPGNYVPGQNEIFFRDDIDLTDKIRFKRHYRRKCKLTEVEVVLLQDVKDVALFTANPKHLTLEFIDFLHIPIVDRFLRALILYFQFYFQVWDKLMIRRIEVKTKIMQPLVTELENIVRDDLSDLRSMVSREYCSMLFGAKDSKKYHHMSNKNHVSLSDRDRRLYEMLIKMSTRIVWIALHKPSYSLIELEMDRLTRTHYFNKFVHQKRKTKILETLECEDRILRGVSDIEQTRLEAQSPLGKETIISDHDHRMLAIGQVDFPPSDDRLRYFEAAYLVPEEDMAKYGICIGILGMPRNNFDVMLKQKRKKVNEDDASRDQLTFNVNIPPRVHHSDDTIPSAYPQQLPRISPKLERQKLIRQQCRMWKTRIEKALTNEDTLTQDLTIGSISQSGLHI